ncbi:hypothetical protein EDB19DRAFT_1834039 [Suillus lakei]|nr:hypothetical protein EDB19DRAFT_1834039 [Suillus lakei]
MQAPSPNSKGVNSNLEESRPCEPLLSLRLQKMSWLQKPGRQRSGPWTLMTYVGLTLRKKINSRRSHSSDNVDVQSVQLKREKEAPLIAMPPPPATTDYNHTKMPHGSTGHVELIWTDNQNQLSTYDYDSASD